MTDTPFRIALTLGDVAGIGPEVVARTLGDHRVLALGHARPLVVGHPEVIERALRLIDVHLKLHVADTLADVDWDSSNFYCWNPSAVAAQKVPVGQISAEAGQAAYDYLVGAIRAALRKDIDAITTAPLNKAALHAAGLNYPGHTEILAQECGVKEFAMMLYLPSGGPVKGEFGLGVAHTTLHTSIKSVPQLLTTPRICETIQLVDGFLKRTGCAAPRVGVCALNPHAGEQGLFGDEEASIIAPAVNSAVEMGINAIGPIPADALLRRAVHGEFDGVVAMYHDQGHIALKLIGFESAVNVTLGLPVVRTSPSHGTAFDIAWQGLARAEGMVEAVRVAEKLARSAGKT